MTDTVSDVIPQPFTVTLYGEEYICQPPRLAHRLILKKVQPMFEAIANMANGQDVDIESDKLLEYQRDLDTLFYDLIPSLKGVTIDEVSLVTLIQQILERTIPAENKELRDNEVEVNSDPKVERAGS